MKNLTILSLSCLFSLPAEAHISQHLSMWAHLSTHLAEMIIASVVIGLLAYTARRGLKSR